MENQRQYLLIVVQGPNAGETYVLQHAVCTIGRTPDNAIVIDSQRISRHHAQLKPAANSLAIEDLNSTNGTWVNGKRLTMPQTLTHGDEIELADDITLRFEIEETAKTERLEPSSSYVATQAMAPQSYQTATPSPASSGAPVPSAPSSVPSGGDATPSWLSGDAELDTDGPSRWTYILIAVLVVLIVICLGTAIYLWFAPTEFWIKLFEIFNIPMP